jgi:aspartate aminotransferase
MKKLKISKRAIKAQFSPIRKFVPLLEKAKKKEIKVFELHIGQPDLPTPKRILKEIKNFKEKILSYTNSLGIERLRLAWQKYFKDRRLKFNLSEIIATTGGSEAILFSFAAICDPGENILVFEPFYANYNGYASIAGIKLKPIRTFAKDGYHLPSKKEIERKIDKRTKAILITNPNNPTGTVYKKEELEMIAKIAKKKNLFILSDETYREFVFDGEKHHSMANFSEVAEKVILLDSVSKKFSACGARIGVLATKNKKVIEAVTKFAQARLSLPHVEQLAVIPLLENSKKYLEKVVAEYKRRRDVVFNALSEIPGVFCQKPKGAFYIFVKIPVKDSDYFTEWLLTKFHFNKKTLMVAPGSGFYATKGLGKDEIRIAFVLDSQKLKEAMKIFKIALGKFLKKNYLSNLKFLL